MGEDAFEPLAVLRIEDALATENADEATQRTAIGGACYAGFLLARQASGVIGQRAAHSRVREAISPTNRRLASSRGNMSEYWDAANDELVLTNPHLRNWSRNWGNVRRNANDVLEALSTLPDIHTNEDP